MNRAQLKKIILNILDECYMSEIRGEKTRPNTIQYAYEISNESFDLYLSKLNSLVFSEQEKNCLVNYSPTQLLDKTAIFSWNNEIGKNIRLAVMKMTQYDDICFVSVCSKVRNEKEILIIKVSQPIKKIKNTTGPLIDFINELNIGGNV